MQAMDAVRSQPVERFVVVGAGTMGAGIAFVAANAGYAVDLVEIDESRSRQASTTLAQQWDRAVAKGKLTAEQAGSARARLTILNALEAVPAGPDGIDVIIEAVPERADLKRSVLRAAEALAPRLLGSNTSSISIGDLAAGLRNPGSFIGLHFFNPVWAMALLEIVVGPATEAQCVQAARALAQRLSKEAVVVADQPGFATSRLGVALGLEAIRMLEGGVASAGDIDRAMVLGYRHPIGPLELTDLVGLDVRLDIARTLQQAYGERFAPPPLLQQLVAQGKLGRKSGEGFYRWVDGTRQPADQAV
jgi:3-hydroxybutyryl-CoA dehydrogenase